MPGHRRTAPHLGCILPQTFERGLITQDFGDLERAALVDPNDIGKGAALIHPNVEWVHTDPVSGSLGSYGDLIGAIVLRVFDANGEFD